MGLRGLLNERQERKLLYVVFENMEIFLRVIRLLSFLENDQDVVGVRGNQNLMRRRRRRTKVVTKNLVKEYFFVIVVQPKKSSPIFRYILTI